MRQKLLVATEKGEGNLTVDLLLAMLTDILHHSLTADDYGGPTCSYVCATLNMLGKLGWIELHDEKKHKGGPGLNTADPPPFFSDLFREEKKGKDGEAHD